MATIDLGTPPTATTWDSVPRRITLTLPELELAAQRAGGAPLPFEASADREESGLAARLGQSRGAAAHDAFVSARAALNEPAASLERRGLLDDPGLSGALGLLATPRLALDIDVTADGVRARAWHRQAGGALATLATVDGLVFEIGWSATSAWPAELARVAVLPEEGGSSEVPSSLDLPYELLDAATEALRTGRSELLPVLAGGYPGGADVAVLTALATEARGRLRVLAADVTAAQTIGVVSWTLLADGWRALRPHLVDGALWVSIDAVSPDDLAAELAPVIAEVAR